MGRLFVLLVALAGASAAQGPPGAVGILRGGPGACTAFVLAGGVIITAAHCVVGSLEQDYRGFTRSGWSFSLELPAGEVPVRVDRVGSRLDDVAVLRFVRSPPRVEPLELSGFVSPIGEALVYWGAPLGLGIQRVTGELTRSSFDGPGDLSGYAVARLLSAQGASGSPVLTPTGRVFGMLVGFRQGPGRAGLGNGGGTSRSCCPPRAFRRS